MLRKARGGFGKIDSEKLRYHEHSLRAPDSVPPSAPFIPVRIYKPMPGIIMSEFRIAVLQSGVAFVTIEKRIRPGNEIRRASVNRRCLILRRHNASPLVLRE